MEEAQHRPLTLRQEAFICAYLGDAHGIGSLAAKMAGYHGKPNVLEVTASDLLRNPKVSAAIAAARASIRAEGIANLETRIASQHKRWSYLLDVVLPAASENGEEATPAKPPDPSLFAEIRQLEQHTAKELGQWEDKTKVSLLSDPEFTALRARLVAALEPYPDALHAVIRAFRGD